MLFLLHASCHCSMDAKFVRVTADKIKKRRRGGYQHRRHQVGSLGSEWRTKSPYRIIIDHTIPYTTGYVGRGTTFIVFFTDFAASPPPNYWWSFLLFSHERSNTIETKSVPVYPPENDEWLGDSLMDF